jgi:DNA-binding NtrC family response regulator
MESILEQIQRVAPKDTTVLLTGETGTGKTRLARLIHELSPRRAQPFLTIDCASLSATLIESELFGHARGSFSGALDERRGKFEQAGRGTVLLDDINVLPLHLQAKLLRAVEERVFEPVGSNRRLPLQARLVAAASRRLEREVAAGCFRSDLYHRLNVVGFCLPALREQPGAMIEAIARHFLIQFTPAGQKRRLAATVVNALCVYSWPGNVRELRNVMERAVALRDGDTIGMEDLPPNLQAVTAERFDLLTSAETNAGQSASLKQTQEEAEAAHIAEALERHNNNRQRAAAELGISRMTLYRKLRRYGIDIWTSVS